MVQKLESCPCGSTMEYSKCCKAVHEDHSLAATPEQLMRSRYSAFVHGDTDFLRRTWTKEHCPEEINLGQDEVKWVRLQIEKAIPPAPKEVIGNVTFSATYISSSQVFTLFEESTFRKEDNLWYYEQGDAKTTLQKIGKNSKCPCLSGKKFKRCCGKT